MFGASPVAYDPSINLYLLINFSGAPYYGAASTARACSSVAVKCKAACLSVYTYKLTSYMSLCLWAILQGNLLMYVGVVELLRNLPLYGGRSDSPLIRDLESRRDVLTGQPTGWALVYATSRRSLRLLCGEYGQIECKNLYAIWRRNHGDREEYGLQTLTEPWHQSSWL